MIRTIDFNNLAAGTAVTDQYEAEGVRISAVANPGGTDGAMIFDSANPTGDDSDLRTDDLEKILIISEDGDASDPDDNSTGGKVTFDFVNEATVKSLTFIDIEEAARMYFYAADGSLISEQYVQPNGNGEISQITLFVEGVDRMVVQLNGSGALDNLVFDDQITPPPAGDGIVSGDDTANDIDLAYTGDPEGDRIDAGDALIAGEAPDDDIVDARGGDDNISALEGDDDVYAGAGNDTVSGGNGDDLIFGDRTLADGSNGTEATRESFNWSELGAADGATVGGFTQDTGETNVTFEVLSSTLKTSAEFSTDTLNTSDIDGGAETVDTNSSLESGTRADGQGSTYQLGFDAPVRDVDFNINDIDGDSVVRVEAFDAAGNPVEVTLNGGAGLTLSDTDAVPGNDTADGDGGYADATNPAYNLNVDIAGPVSRIVITHTQDGAGGSDINITDVFFTAGGMIGMPGGDDDLSGDDGNDTIYGEGGNDTLTGGTGADSLSGGDDADLFVGGGDGDVVDGGTGGDDRDTLDVSNEGPLRVVDETVDADGDSTSGTIEFLNADGSVRGAMTFREIEELILPGNNPPVAEDDIEDAVEDETIVIDVLANDSDPDGDPIRVTEASSPDGTVSINADGTLSFTPNPDFNGDTTIDYTITDDNGGFDTAQVSLFVDPRQDPPVAEDDTATTDEDTTVTVAVLTNDSDPDGDPLTVTEATSAFGEVTINADGTLDFTPNPDFFGEATIDYTITDGNGGTDSATVTVTVNDVDDAAAPVAEDDVATTDEETPVTIPVLDNDSDPNGDPLTVIAATSPDGDVVINPDGTVTFTPNPDFFGEATIDYTITDGQGGFDDSIVTVTVNNLQDPPVAEDDSATTPEDTAVTIPVLANDSDPDGDPLTVTAATSPDGDVVINADGTLTFTPAPNFNGDAEIAYTISDGNGGTDDAVVRVSVGEVSDPPVAEDDVAETDEDTPVTIDVLVNDSDPDGDLLTVTAATSPDGDVVINPDGTLDFTPNPDFNGPTTITYTVSDGNGGEDTATVDVTVNPVNDDPTAEDDTAITNQGAPVTIPVLANDSDPEGDPLTVIAASSPDGDVVINDDGTITFAPDPDFSGEATINYSVGDGNGGTDPAVVTVTVRDGIVEGTDDPDLIDVDYDGDPEGDVVDGGDGFLPGEGPDDDIIEAGGGDDTVIAGQGSDDVTGGAGDDSIDTGNGEVLPDIGYPGLFDPDPQPEDDRDSVDGGAGDDTIRTGDDRDTILGGDGEDVINAGIDDDEVSGGADDDRIVGGEGSDSITGDDGDDLIYAGNDPDEIPDGLDIPDDGSGPFGPDLRPENGRDTVDGGAGNDTIFGADDDDLLIGGAGDDSLDGEIDDDTLLGGTGADTLIGGQGDDSLEGGRGEDSLDGGIGNDTLRGNRENDTLLGGEGDDLLDGGQDDDSLSGGAGDDTLEGALGDDTLSGGAGDDEMRGGSGDDLFDGGAGVDTMTGGGDRDNFINVNAGDVVDGSETGDDFDCLDLTGSAPAGGSLNIQYDPTNVENGVVQYRNAAGEDAGQLVFSNIEKVIPCFTPGTKIATPQGERPVETLEVGDRIITRDNGMQVIRWVGKREMSGEELAAKEHLRPVLIRQGALGNGLPERDMMVSPQHRVLVANDKTALYFEEREVLVAAKHLTDMEGIDVVEVSSTTYIHIMFDRHEVVLSDGTWTESFQPGDMSLAGVGDASREEILELFPELATQEGIDAYASARKALKKHEAKLITR